MLKTIIKRVAYLFYLLLFVIALMEIIYRYQVIEFFQPDLNALNLETDLKANDDRKTVLICGDSFTAFPHNYGKILRDSLPSFRFINSAIIGSSIVETSLIAPKRVKEFNPDIFIYQIYVGNDLLGIRHDLNWKEISWLRNIYWWLSERIHFLWYANFRSGQLKSYISVPQEEVVVVPDQFSQDHYRKRERLYANMDPYLINNSVLLKNGREKDLEYLEEKLDHIISELKPSCKVYLLVIPHKAQISYKQRHRMEQVGYDFSKHFGESNEYPFINSLKEHYSGNENIDILNPLLRFQQVDAMGIPLYFSTDEHLNQTGHQLLASFVKSEIEEF